MDGSDCTISGLVGNVNWLYLNRYSDDFEHIEEPRRICPFWGIKMLDGTWCINVASPTYYESGEVRSCL